MSDADTTPSARHRRGRYALLAVIVALTAIGATAIGAGVLHRTDEPALTISSPSVSPAEPTDESAPEPGDAASDVLTTGPLMVTSPPTRVSIPALKVTASTIGLGQEADGSMQVPSDAKTVGWYTKAPTPGALGPAVLAGHVDLKGKPGSFAQLTRLKTGDAITVERSDGSTAMFAVTTVQRYAKNKFPSAAVYGAIDHAGLRLITCGGAFDDTTGHYRDNIVVYATLKHAHPA